MLELGTEKFYGVSNAQSLSHFIFETKNIEVKKEFVKRVYEKYYIDLTEGGVQFYPEIEEQLTKILKKIAKEQGIRFKMKEIK